VMLHKERSDGEAARMATIDPLTGAYNRRTFHDIAERELGRAVRAGQPLSIIVVDIDHFRPVNEQHGNRTGDEVLRKVADLIRTALRKEDMLVRFGGEEFLVLLPETDRAGLARVAEKLRAAVEALNLEQVGTVTTSLGGAVAEDGAGDAALLLERADQALYGAKAAGRNRVVVSA